MILYPAIDLMGGRVVRLAQGRFDDATIYSDDPADEPGFCEVRSLVEAETARARRSKLSRH